jgi:hypothetical protein
MKLKRCLFLLIPLVMAGCAHHYVLTLNNGQHLTTASKPKLIKGYYCYKDAQGKDVYVAAGRVREIAPASMATQEGSQFRPSAN